MEMPPADVSTETFSFHVNQEPDPTTVELAKPSRPRDAFENLSRSAPTFSENPLGIYTPEGLREFIDSSQKIGDHIELRGKLMTELVEQL